MSSMNQMIIQSVLVLAISITLYYTIQLNHLNRQQVDDLHSIRKLVTINNDNQRLQNHLSKPLAWVYGENVSFKTNLNYFN